MKTIFDFKMNTKDLLMLTFSTTFLLYVLFIFINNIAKEELAEIQFKSVTNPMPRQSITFILGEDKEQENPYYSNAEDYFKHNPEGMTDHVVTHCRSLVEVLNVLDRYHELIKQPFGLVNIVSHSNPWTGISMSIFEDGERINADRLENAMKDNLINISAGGIDKDTKIVFHSCGLGNNDRLVKALEASFTANHERKPLLVADDRYVNFRKEGDQVFRNEMEVFYAFYPTAYKPADLHLVRQLNKRYPDMEIDWLQALNQQTLSNESDVFSYRYNVPIEWEILYPEYDVPLLPTREDGMEWIMNQDKLIELVEKTEIPFKDFRWIVKKGDKEYEEGYSVPFIKVFGKATVVCILRPVTKNDPIKV